MSETHVSVAELEFAWQTLLLAGPPDAGEIKGHTVGGQLPSGRSLVGIDSAGLRHFLVPTPVGERVREDRNGRGIMLTRHVMLEGGFQRAFVDIACREAVYQSAFGYLAAEMLNELMSTPGNISEACIKAINRWRALLAREVISITRETLIGLAGELLELRELVKLDSSAVRVWGGPIGQRHDFSNGFTSLEVKSTTSRHSLSVTISSIDQLEAMPRGELFLVVWSLEELTEGGMTLLTLIDEVRAMSSDPDQFMIKVRQYGVDPRAIDQLSSFHFLERECKVFRVDDGFPRIIDSKIEGGLSPQIMKVQYEIDLTGPTPVQISKVDVEAAYNSVLFRSQIGEAHD